MSSTLSPWAYKGVPSQSGPKLRQSERTGKNALVALPFKREASNVSINTEREKNPIVNSRRCV